MEWECGIKQPALTQFHIKKIGANIEKQIIPNELEVNQQEETVENIDENISKAEILWSLFCAEHDIAFLVNKHAPNIFKNMFPNSAIAAGYTFG